jgi:hypothetical protein
VARPVERDAGRGGAEEAEVGLKPDLQRNQ